MCLHCARLGGPAEELYFIHCPQPLLTRKYSIRFEVLPERLQSCRECAECSTVGRDIELIVRQVGHRCHLIAVSC